MLCIQSYGSQRVVFGLNQIWNCPVYNNSRPALGAANLLVV